MNARILELLESNSKLSAQDIAIFTGETAEAVQAEIAALEKASVICGYNTLINWDKTERDFVTALIEVKVTPARGQGFDKIAERIYRFDEVRAVYLMSGGYDLVVILEGKTMKDIAHFVSDKLSPLESVVGTATHFVLKKYKDHGIVLEKKDGGDERMIISP